MGAPKLLLPWNNDSVMGQVLKCWCHTAVNRIVVVIRADDTELQKLCSAESPAENIDLVLPPIPPPDMKTSVLHALSFIEHHYRPSESDVWLLAPADMPMISIDVIQSVMRSYDPRDPKITLPVHGERRGHPVLFPWAMVKAIRSLGPDEGINRLVRSLPCLLLPVSDKGVLQDLDNPDDYRNLLREPSTFTNLPQ